MEYGIYFVFKSEEEIKRLKEEKKRKEDRGDDKNVKDIFTENKNDDDKIFFNDVIYMQYTGKRDKNGKKIFAGDIIKRVYFNTKDQVEKVFYGLVEHYEFGFIYKNAYGQYYPLGTSGVEMIGNLYETPELLIYLYHRN